MGIKRRPEFPSDVKRKVIERSSNKCERCDIDFDEDFTGKFHHISPVVSGWDNRTDNCSLLCRNCHQIVLNLKKKVGILIYEHYFLRFKTSEEAARYWRVDNKFDWYIKAALDIAKKSKKEFWCSLNYLR